jgi:hypothetical protein
MDNSAQKGIQIADKYKITLGRVETRQVGELGGEGGETLGVVSNL